MFLTDDALTLRPDSPSGGPDAPGMQETRIAAGSALLGMRLALAVQGRRPDVALLPVPEQPDVLALLRRGMHAPPQPQERQLHALVGATAVSRAAVPEAAVRYALRRAAAEEGVWLRTATDRTGLVALGGRRDVPPAGMYATVGGDARLAVTDLRVGQALHRVLLTAAWLGLHASVVHGPGDLAARGPHRPLLVLALRGATLAAAPPRCTARHRRTASGWDRAPATT